MNEQMNPEQSRCFVCGKPRNKRMTVILFRYKSNDQWIYSVLPKFKASIFLEFLTEQKITNEIIETTELIE